MQKIKYSDKLDGINFRTFESYDFKVKSDSLEGLIEKICKKRKYKKIKDDVSYIEINVESLNNDTWILMSDIFPKELSVLEVKRLSSFIATKRIIALAPDFSEIYFEVFHVKTGCSSSSLFYFDYSLLYGNYKPLDLSKLVRTNVPWEMYKTKTSYYIVERLLSDPNRIIKLEDIELHDLYCMYGGTLYDSNNEVVGYIEDIENPVPLSLIYKYIDK